MQTEGGYTLNVNIQRFEGNNCIIEKYLQKTNLFSAEYVTSLSDKKTNY